MPVTGNMPTPPNGGGTVMANRATVVMANDAQIQD